MIFKRSKLHYENKNFDISTTQQQFTNNLIDDWSKEDFDISISKI